MKKGTVAILVIALVAALVFWGVGKYNGLVSDQEKVEAQWAKVESAYQRRADLIPNLVQTVKGYAKHEEETLAEVVEARAKATSVTVDPANLTDESLAQFQQAQAGLTSALGRLLVVREAYPELKADKMFLELQTQLEGTENRINVERNAFNDVAKEYNVAIRQFPVNVIASMFGFQQKPYFQADENASKAPVVSFE